MNYKWAKTIQALKEIFQVLDCSQCRKKICSNNQFLNCGHFTCVTCSDNNRIKCFLCNESSNENDATFKKIKEACSIIAEEIGFEENNEPNPHTSSEPVKNVFKDETKPKFVKRGKRKRRLVDNAAPSKVSKVQFKIPKVMEKKNHLGETRLQVECKKRHIENVKALLDAKADPNTRCAAGWTPLHEAAEFGFLDIVQLLLEYGADVNKAGFEDRVPLQEAIKQENYPMIDLFLKFNANTKLLDENEKKFINNYLEKKNSESPKINKSSNQQVVQASSSKKKNWRVLKNQKSIEDFIIRKSCKTNIKRKNEAVNNNGDMKMYKNLNNQGVDPETEDVQNKSVSKRVNRVDTILVKKTNDFSKIKNSKNASIKKTNQTSARINQNKSNNNKLNIREDDSSSIESSETVDSLTDLDSDDIIDVES